MTVTDRQLLDSVRTVCDSPQFTDDAQRIRIIRQIVDTHRPGDTSPATAVKTVAVVTTAGGLLTDDSTLTINGVAFPIPTKGELASGTQTTFAPHRIVQAIKDAGYRKVGMFTERDSDRVEIEVEPAAEVPADLPPRDEPVRPGEPWTFERHADGDLYVRYLTESEDGTQ
jgi:hypothetical protein